MADSTLVAFCGHRAMTVVNWGSAMSKFAIWFTKQAIQLSWLISLVAYLFFLNKIYEAYKSSSITEIVWDVGAGAATFAFVFATISCGFAAVIFSINDKLTEIVEIIKKNGNAEFKNYYARRKSIAGSEAELPDQTGEMISSAKLSSEKNANEIGRVEAASSVKMPWNKVGSDILILFAVMLIVIVALSIMGGSPNSESSTSQVVTASASNG